MEGALEGCYRSRRVVADGEGRETRAHLFCKSVAWFLVAISYYKLFNDHIHNALERYKKSKIAVLHDRSYSERKE